MFNISTTIGGIEERLTRLENNPLLRAFERFPADQTIKMFNDLARRIEAFEKSDAGAR